MTAPGTVAYVASMDAPCSHCGGPTIAPTPGRPEEVGFYCEACGNAWEDTAPAAGLDAVLDAALDAREDVLITVGTDGKVTTVPLADLDAAWAGL